MTVILVAASSTAVATSDRWTETGLASWYGPGFAGKPTASSEIYDPNAMTAAHKTLPLGSLVRVENLQNSRTVIVRINDRGPFKARRIIDVSRAAAKVLDFHDDGLVEVRIEVIGHQYPSKTTTRPNVVAAETGTAVAVASATKEDGAAPVVEGGVSFAASGRGFTEESLPAPAAPAGAAAPATTNTAPAATSASSSPAGAAPAVASPVEAATATDASSAASQDAGAGEEHFLQIGMFDQEKNAWPILHKAQALGLNGEVQGADGKKFRAVVGPFASLADARDAQTRLKEAGIDSFVRKP
jgi:rare lipoprotein A